MLSWFTTSILYDPTRFPYSAIKLLPRGLRERAQREISRREFPRLDNRFVQQFGWLEWAAVPFRRARMTNAARAISEASARSGAKKVNSLIKGTNIESLWTFDTVGLEALKVAKEAGVRSVLDQTIGHMASLDRALREEARKNPKYFRGGTFQIPTRAIDRQAEELMIADAVVVGSNFAADTLVQNGISKDKITVLRYGFDEMLFDEPTLRRTPQDRPIKFLMVGSINPRKGAQYLFEAFRHISPTAAEIHIVGPMEISPDLIPSDLPHVHIHPSVARKDIPRVMKSADCLILPSLFEGCSLSLHEGVASGLPIIHSTSAGDGIVDGNGLILDRVSTECVLEAVTKVVDQPSLIEEWSHRSGALASAHSAVAYRERVRRYYLQ
ncbi:Glycosyl transferases group 1 [Bradyrhizobium shewense]|uniref:Glycosyl transferases group 1 n=1 Tax=Bradyrhizobium shewense TaxID=1761772 RepID=A0A1C3VH87_9BRAD|nr:glycosyltransferase family 4 protein [Bradyrhizobium shewense]SCB26884.1 Glycosyl transferases group 1 [Bradyrhizobium shewense]